MNSNFNIKTMKIKYAIAASLLISISAFAQKDELKALKKLESKQAAPTAADIQEYKRLLTELESKLGSATDEQKIDFYYYKGSFAAMELMTNPMTAQTNFPIAKDNLKKVIEMEKNGKKKYTQVIEDEIFSRMKAGGTTIAAELNKQKQHKAAAQYYLAAYELDPKDPSNLYNAAAMAVNGQDYDNALKHYEELNKIGFTGEGTVYTARNKQTGMVETFPNQKTRDLSVTAGQHVDPRQEQLPSLKGEIVKNIALIYIQRGEIEKAKQAMNDAKKANPDDVGLIISEADLYLKTNDMETYKRLINEALQKNPKNADLFFNLGVVTSSTNPEEAAKHYQKALEIDPNYVNAMINLGILTIADEQKIVDEMNSLGSSAKDNQRYDVLKKKRDDMFNKALPYFEKAHSIQPDNQDVIGMLASIYQAMDRTADYNKMKAKMK